MTRGTEWLLRFTLALVILWLGYGLAERTVLSILQANQRVAIAEQSLKDCTTKKVQ